MNLEKMLDLAIETKTINHDAIDEIISMLKNELEATIAKQSGVKNTYKAIKNYIKHIHKYHDGTRESFECLLKSENNKFYITDTFGVVEFSGLDIKDLPISDKENLLSWMPEMIDNCQKRNTNKTSLPSEKEILFSYKTQLAEHNNNCDYTIYIKLGNSYYNPNLLSKLLAMMGENVKAFYCDTIDKELFLTDELGNRAVLMPLHSKSIHIREE
jgi:hypothetical protein